MKNIDRADVLIGRSYWNICFLFLHSTFLKRGFLKRKNLKNVTKRIKETIEKDDVILLKASKAMNFSEIALDMVEKYSK